MSQAQPSNAAPIRTQQTSLSMVPAAAQLPGNNLAPAGLVASAPDAGVVASDAYAPGEDPRQVLLDFKSHWLKDYSESQGTWKVAL